MRRPRSAPRKTLWWPLSLVGLVSLGFIGGWSASLSLPSLSIASSVDRGEQQHTARHRRHAVRSKDEDIVSRVSPPPRWTAGSAVGASSHTCYGRGFGPEGPEGEWRRTTCQYTNVCYFANWYAADGGAAPAAARVQPSDSNVGARQQQSANDDAHPTPHWGSGRGALVYIAASEAEAALLRRTQELDVSLSPLLSAAMFSNAEALRTRANKTGRPSTRLSPITITRAQFNAALAARSKNGSRSHTPWSRSRTSSASPRVRTVSNVHVLYTSYNAENFGHVLSDELLPAYAAMEAFGALDYNVQLLRAPTLPMVKYSCDWQSLNWGEVQAKKCARRYADLVGALSGNGVAELGAYNDRVLGGGSAPICFDNLIAGEGYLSDHCDDYTKHGANTGAVLRRGRPAQRGYGRSFDHYAIAKQLPKQAAEAQEKTTKPSHVWVPFGVEYAHLGEEKWLTNPPQPRVASQLTTPCNQGRAVTYYGFRDWSMRALGVPPSSPTQFYATRTLRSRAVAKAHIARVRGTAAAAAAATAAERGSTTSRIALTRLAPLRVVIWDRDAREQKGLLRKVFGLDTLAAKLRTTHGGDVDVVTVSGWGGLSFREQVKLLASASVFITGPGSGSFIGWYLPRGATMIRIYPTKFPMEWHIFSFMAHIHTEYMDEMDPKNNEANKIGVHANVSHALLLTEIALRRFEHVQQRQAGAQIVLHKATPAPTREEHAAGSMHSIADAKVNAALRSPAGEEVKCDEWKCDCQVLADIAKIMHSRSDWGSATVPQKAWWHTNACHANQAGE